MGYEDTEANEKVKSGKPTTSSNLISFQKAIELGEYNPDYLATFPEWHTLSRHMQFEYVRKALENRNHQLLSQWAEINNMIDYHLKPNLKVALANIEKQLKKVAEDKEQIYLEYSS